MDLKKDCRYALACVTSMGVRITPEDRMPVHTSDRFFMQATSAETNVLNVAASLGLPCLALTKFVKGSPVAAFIQAHLRERGIDYLGKEEEQGGPWGFRHQFNIADSGFGLRAPRVWNDRAGEVGRTIRADDYDLARIFDRDGVRLLHLSGLIAAMSEETTEACVRIAEYAKKAGTLVSFDLNYRASFWKGRETELREAFTRIASCADILLGNEEDYQLCFGIEGPEAGGRGLTAKVSSYRALIGRVRDVFPGVKVCAATLREVLSANEHLWGAILWEEGQWYTEMPRPVPVLDRIGGGDGFAGGLLYGILSGFAPEKQLGFGWACGVMAVSSLYDYAQPADEKQVWDVYAGNARVVR